jgi:hypothetical protein
MRLLTKSRHYTSNPAKPACAETISFRHDRVTTTYFPDSGRQVPHLDAREVRQSELSLSDELEILDHPGVAVVG